LLRGKPAFARAGALEHVPRDLGRRSEDRDDPREDSCPAFLMNASQRARPCGVRRRGLSRDTAPGTTSPGCSTAPTNRWLCAARRVSVQRSIA